MKIMLSVIVLSYNHEKYIRHAIESIINQPKNFEYEILVCDDASHDNTVEIINKLQKDYENVRFNLYVNDVSRGASLNVYNMFMKSQGEYVTILEGDDYWEITGELQKSISFLEKNKEYIGISRENKNFDEKRNFQLGEDVKFLECDKVTDLQGYLLGKQVGTCLYRNFYRDSKEDFSIIYKSSRMLYENVVGFLVVEHGTIYHTGKAWEVKRTNRIAGSQNYNSMNNAYKVFEEVIQSFNELEKYRPEYDFFHRYEKWIVKMFYSSFFDKNWLYMKRILQMYAGKRKKRILYLIVISLNKYIKKYFYDKKQNKLQAN